jgi:hypothetical protein
MSAFITTLPFLCIQGFYDFYFLVISIFFYCIFILFPYFGSPIVTSNFVSISLYLTNSLFHIALLRSPFLLLALLPCLPSLWLFALPFPTYSCIYTNLSALILYASLTLMLIYRRCKSIAEKLIIVQLQIFCLAFTVSKSVSNKSHSYRLVLYFMS